MRLCSLCVAATLLLVSAACPSWSPPAGTVIACASDDDCPRDFTCKEGIGLCRPAKDESEPPRVREGEAEVVPSIAGPDTTVTVSFQANEPLFQAPTLTLVAGDARRAFDAASLNGDASTATIVIDAADPSGEAQVLARLVDLAGNVTEDALVGTLTIDTDAPSAVSVAAVPYFAADGAAVTLSITASEALNADGSTLEVAGGLATLLAGENGSLTAQIDVDAIALGEGPVTGELVLRDAAGNRSTALPLVLFEVDSEAPVATLQAATEAAAPGGVISASLQFQEILEVAPTVALVSAAPPDVIVRAMQVAELGPSLYVATANVLPGDPDGTYAIVVSGAVDRAGNTSAAQQLGAIAVDATAPAFTSVPSASPAVLSRVAGFSSAAVTFTAGEPVTALVSLGERVLPCASDDDLAFACALEVDDTDAAGAQNLFVTVVDRAGNPAFSATGVFIDDAPPSVFALATALEPSGALPTATVLGLGGVVRITLRSDEPLAAAPVAASVPAGLSFSLASQDGDTVTFQATVAAGTPEGAFDVEVTWSDAVGNAATVALGQDINVDRTAPAAPPVGTADAIVFERVPWGDASSSARRFSVRVASPPADVVLAIAYSDMATFAELGRAATSPGARVDLGGADRQVVAIAFADAAGNISERALVRDVSWTATLGGKIAGSTLENPHGFHHLGFADASRQVGVADETNAASAARAGDGQAVTTNAAASFKTSSTGASPIALVDPAVAYDAARGRIVALSAQVAGDTWEHDGSHWQLRALTDPEGDGNPSLRPIGARLAYDAARGESVLFGGDGANIGNTWVFNGASWRLAQENAAGDGGPDEVWGPALAYDGARGQVVLFGGELGFPAATVDTTWVWDGLRWSERCATACTPPPPREGAAMAFDPDRGVLVLFGGIDQGAPFDDVWEWNGVTWTGPIVPATRPSARALPGLAWDPQRREVLLFGGGGSDLVEGVGALNDVWSWNGTRWLPITPDDPEQDGNPSARSGQRGVSRAEDVAFVGGAFANDCIGGAPNPFAECSGPAIWDGVSFLDHAQEPASAPAARLGAAMAFDSARGVSVMFGGGIDTNFSFHFPVVDDDVWEHNGARWRIADTQFAGIKPTARQDAVLVYDEDNAVSVMFGGTSAGACDAVTGGASDDIVYCPSFVWLWDGAAWTRVDPAGAEPSPRRRHAMAFDRTRGVVVLFGGAAEGSCDGRATCDTVWEYDVSAATWSARTPTDVEGDGNPAAREHHVLVYDAARAETVLVGGRTEELATPCGESSFSDFCDDTWTWNGTRWRRAQTTFATTARFYSAAVYDEGRARPVIVGGIDNGANMMDVLEWNGSAWVPRSIADPDADGVPAPRGGHAASYDSVRGQIVMHGGGPNLSATDATTYLLDTGARVAAAQQVDFLFSAAGAPTSATLVGLDLTASAVSSPGAPTLQVWDGQWREVDATAPLQFSTTSAVEIGRMLFGTGRSLGVRVRGPAAGNSPSSSVTTDGVQAVFRYRLP
jgi:Kelch motif